MTTFILSPLERLAVFAYGADRAILALCPPHERKRVVMMGILVMVPALLALFSGRCAVQTFSDNPWVVNGFSLLYAALVFVLDRAIVMLNPTGHFTPALAARCALAVVLAFIVAEPLVLQVFDDQIKQREQTNKDAIAVRVTERYAPILQRLEAEMTECEKETDRLQKVYQEEYKGGLGSGKVGIGELADEDARLWNEHKSQCAQLRQRNEAKIQNLDSMRQANIALQNRMLATGLAGRIGTLHEVMQDDSIIAWAAWLFRMALFFIEILPLMLKFSRYDEENPDLYADLVALRSREHLHLAHSLSDFRMNVDRREGQHALMEQRDKLETRILHRLAENRRAQLAFILERQRSMQRLKEEAIYLYDTLESDAGKQDAYRQFVDRASEDYQRRLFIIYQRFAAAEMPE